LILYAESSAVVAWLLGEAAGSAVRGLLAGADGVVTSELTLVECDRVLIRAQATGVVPEAVVASRRQRLNAAAAQWTVLALGPEVMDRARRPFPAEPVRALDAIHLASALVARGELPDLALVSLDERVRRNGADLGFEVGPTPAPGAPPASPAPPPPPPPG